MGNIILLNNELQVPHTPPKGEASDAQLVLALRRQNQRLEWISTRLAQKLDGLHEALKLYYQSDRSPATLEALLATLEGTLMGTAEVFSSDEAPSR